MAPAWTLALMAAVAAGAAGQDAAATDPPTPSTAAAGAADETTAASATPQWETQPQTTDGGATTHVAIAPTTATDDETGVPTTTSGGGTTGDAAGVTTAADAATADPCNAIPCALDCNGTCGWSSSVMMCMSGETTSTTERYLRMGNCTTTTTAPSALACEDIMCVYECSGGCGWDSDNDVCRAGLTTSELAIELGLGDCDGVTRPTTSRTTPTSAATTTTSCEDIMCVYECSGGCGWDSDNDVCRAGLTTSELAIELGLGDCDGVTRPGGGAAEQPNTTATAELAVTSESAASTTAAAVAQATESPTAAPTLAPTVDDDVAVTTTTPQAAAVTDSEPATTEPTTACSDSPTYRDPSNYSCAEWRTFSCMLASAAFGYTTEQQADLIRHCPLACRVCADMGSTTVPTTPSTLPVTTSSSSSSSSSPSSSSSSSQAAVAQETTTPAETTAVAATPSPVATSAHTTHPQTTARHSTTSAAAAATSSAQLMTGSDVCIQAGNSCHWVDTPCCDGLRCRWRDGSKLCLHNRTGGVETDTTMAPVSPPPSTAPDTTTPGTTAAAANAAASPTDGTATSEHRSSSSAPLSTTNAPADDATTTPAASSVTAAALPSTTTAPSCTDVAGWADLHNRTCAVYAHRKLCYANGTAGSGWVGTWPSKRTRYQLYGHSVAGVLASAACCACGGGARVVTDDAANRGDDAQAGGGGSGDAAGRVLWPLLIVACFAIVVGFAWRARRGKKRPTGRYASLHDKLNGTTFNDSFGGGGGGAVGGGSRLPSIGSSMDEADLDRFLESEDDMVFRRA